MESEDKKILDYWKTVKIKYENKKRNESEESHYQHALKTIKKLEKITNNNFCFDNQKLNL